MMEFETVPEKIKETLQIQLPQYKVESPLGPNSGRISRTFRLRRKEVRLVCKVVFLKNAPDLEELERIKKALKGQKHVAPYLQWIHGDPNRKSPSRPLYLLRPHFYTTLSDRIASRPWLTSIEKLWIFQQILESVHAMHRAGVVHGFLHTENIGLTSSNWVVILDLYGRPTYLKSDDPTDYIKHFHSSRKRCYIAPERFQDDPSREGPLTSAMDVFSCGCILAELYGEQSFDLGDLLEYRKTGVIPSNLLKIESSTLRAAAKHMMTLNPLERLTIPEYLDRLDTPSSFKVLSKLAESCSSVTSLDSRLAIIAQSWDDALWSCCGVEDLGASAYLRRISNSPAVVNFEDADKLPSAELFDETLSLLEALENPLPETESYSVVKGKETRRENRPTSCQDSILIYIHLILSDIRHLSRVSSRLVGLQLLRFLTNYCPDEIRLQRLVPTLVTMLQDQDALVRAHSLKALTEALSSIKSFSPSDSKLFSQYIFKRVSPLLSDPSLSVRLAFAENIALLAESALRFLDVTHAVRLYDAIENDATGNETVDTDPHLFDETTARLLDTNRRTCEVFGGNESLASKTPLRSTRSLICSTYGVDLSGLHEIVSRWIMQINTDQSEYSTICQRALLKHLEKLCSFFGCDGVMTFLLPQILTFLNNRDDHDLRGDLFHNLPIICRLVGKAATEEYVLPCLEAGLLDADDSVVCSTLICTTELLYLGLLSRLILVTTPGSRKKDSFLQRCISFLIHPSSYLRDAVIHLIDCLFSLYSSQEIEHHIIPVIQPFLRCHPAWETQEDCYRLSKCLIARVSWEKLEKEETAMLQHAPVGGLHDWTEVQVALDGYDADEFRSEQPHLTIPESKLLACLSKRKRDESKQSKLENALTGLRPGIEASSKLAQNVMFPKLTNLFSVKSMPEWYLNIRRRLEEKGVVLDESLFIQSVSDLGSVFGLSILGSGIESAGNDTISLEEANDTVSTKREEIQIQDVEIVKKALRGLWLAEASVHPLKIDTILMLGKLKALGVPPLPPSLGGIDPTVMMPHISSARGSSTKDVDRASPEWAGAKYNVVASSRSINGHSEAILRLAVSFDNAFFVTGSQDGTCRLWKNPCEDSGELLESSATYSEQQMLSGRDNTINDIAMIESSHSIVSGASDGSIHVWKADLVHSGSRSDEKNSNLVLSGATTLKKMHTKEGGILAVSHFNGPVASVITYASQRGYVHSCDLRSRAEPFLLKHSPGLGYLTTMAMGTDRQWIAVGTSKGYIGIWDIRFQTPLSLWRVNHRSPVTRLATSYTENPSVWGTQIRSHPRPYIFVSSAQNECAMYDVQTGLCQQCFRSVSGGGPGPENSNELPALIEQRLASARGSMRPTSSDIIGTWDHLSLTPKVNCMVGNVGLDSKSFLITGSSDSHLRFWDFFSPSRCGILGAQHDRQQYFVEKFDFSDGRRLMLCHHTTNEMLSPDSSANVAPSTHAHSDSIEDIKFVDRGRFLSCSRDSTVKLWANGL